MIGLSWYLAKNPDDGFVLINIILAITLILAGIGYLIYYFRMARHMVSGKMVLLCGLIILDFGLFATSVSDEPRIFIIGYLLVTHIFSGVLNLIKGIREKMTSAPGWGIDLAQGVGNLLIAAACIIYIHSNHILVGLYCAGLLYSGILRLVTAFRRTSIVYIP